MCNFAAVGVLIVGALIALLTFSYTCFKGMASPKLKKTNPETLKGKFEWFPLEYPEGLPPEKWIEEVSAKETILGYWEWAAMQLDQRVKDPCHRCGERNTPKVLHPYQKGKFVCRPCRAFFWRNHG
jgi:hypothetical protein